MIINSNSTSYKKIKITFINVAMKTFLLSLLFVIIIILCSFSVFANWSEEELIIKIFWPTLLVHIFIVIIVTNLTGMVITKAGTISFLPDFKVKKCNIDELERLAITFTEWENNKYSVTVKFIYKNGKVFCKDYSQKFSDSRFRKILMSVYTINKRKVDKICEKIMDIDVCAITIVNKTGNAIYYNK
mgnify:FL=1